MTKSYIYSRFVVDWYDKCPIFFNLNVAIKTNKSSKGRFICCLPASAVLQTVLPLLYSYFPFTAHPQTSPPHKNSIVKYFETKKTYLILFNRAKI